MKQIIGLKKVLNKIENCDNLPHSFCLVGLEGAGKHLLVDYINEKFFKFDYLDITKDLSDELLDQMYISPNKRLYVVDINELTEKDQNKLLKILEEPSEVIYMAILCTNVFTLLPTIRNRVQVFNLDEYKEEELIAFKNQNSINIKDEYIKRKLLKTPGSILKIKTNNIKIEDIEKLCLNIVDNMKKASFTNALSISDKLNYKDNYDKLDLDLFLNILYNLYCNKYIETSENICYECSKIVNKTITDMNIDSRLNKEKMIKNMIINLWEVNRHGL